MFSSGLREALVLIGVSMAVLSGTASTALSGRDDAFEFALVAPEEKAASELYGMPLLFRDDFQSGKAPHWEMSDPKAWRVESRRKNYILSQFQQSVVKTPVRSPYNRALVKDVIVSDFVLDLRLQSTGKDGAHRDMCLFFGYQDPRHFYYAHLAKTADKHANQIFIVNDADRLKISTESTEGTKWDDDWHHARIIRKAASGTILVYFDNMEKPAMKAVDKTFSWGQVGVGSFDDTGNFDNVLVYGVKAVPLVKKRIVP